MDILDASPRFLQQEAPDGPAPMDASIDSYEEDHVLWSDTSGTVMPSSRTSESGEVNGAMASSAASKWEPPDMMIGPLYFPLAPVANLDSVSDAPPEAVHLYQESSSFVPWHEFAVWTLNNLRCALVDEDLVSEILTSKPDPYRWLLLRWDHGQLTGCRYGPSGTSWLRSFSIADSARCKNHLSSECLVLARGLEGGRRKNADIFISYKDEFTPTDEPVTLCRPCYELSEGTLWRQACDIRTTSGQDVPIVWDRGRWCSVLAWNQRVPVDNRDLNPLCADHSASYASAMARSAAMPTLSNLAVWQNTPRARILADQAPNLFEFLWHASPAVGSRMPSSGLTRLGSASRPSLVKRYMLQTIYITQLQKSEATIDSDKIIVESDHTANATNLSALVELMTFRTCRNEVQPMWRARIRDDITCPTHGLRECMVLVEAERTRDDRTLRLSVSCQSDIPPTNRPTSRCEKCESLEGGADIPVLATRVSIRSSPLFWRSGRWTLYRTGPRGRHYDCDDLLESYCVFHSGTLEPSLDRRRQDRRR